MIEFDCPHCANRLEVAEEFANHDGWCRVCKKPVHCPDASGMPALGQTRVTTPERLTALVEFAARKADAFKEKLFEQRELNEYLEATLTVIQSRIDALSTIEERFDRVEAALLLRRDLLDEPPYLDAQRAFEHLAAQAVELVRTLGGADREQPVQEMEPRLSEMESSIATLVDRVAAAKALADHSAEQHDLRTGETERQIATQKDAVDALRASVDEMIRAQAVAEEQRERDEHRAVEAAQEAKSLRESFDALQADVEALTRAHAQVGVQWDQQARHAAETERQMLALRDSLASAQDEMSAMKDAHALIAGQREQQDRGAAWTEQKLTLLGESVTALKTEIQTTLGAHVVAMEERATQAAGRLTSLERSLGVLTAEFQRAGRDVPIPSADPTEILAPRLAEIERQIAALSGSFAALGGDVLAMKHGGSTEYERRLNDLEALLERLELQVRAEATTAAPVRCAEEQQPDPAPASEAKNSEHSGDTTAKSETKPEEDPPMVTVEVVDDEFAPDEKAMLNILMNFMGPSGKDGGE
jgi:chromosome segregation ATPase